MTSYEQEAYDLGCEHARAAASWVLDGNLPVEHYHNLLAMIEADDCEVWDYFSGEWADDPTPSSLLHDFLPAGYMRDDEADPVADGTMEALIDAYERGVDDTFYEECERLLRSAVAS